MDVLYYQKTSGRSPVEEFVRSLSEVAQEQFFEAVTRLENNEKLVEPISKNLTNVRKGLHELRIKDRHGIYRVFYYIKVKDAIYMLHAFKKKTQRTPQKELKLALKRLKEIR